MVKKTGMSFVQAIQCLKENGRNVIGAGRKAWHEACLIKFVSSYGNAKVLVGMNNNCFTLTIEDYFANDWFIKEKDTPVKVEGWAIIHQDGSVGLNEDSKLFKTYDEANNSVVPEGRAIVFINQIVPDPNEK